MQLSDTLWGLTDPALSAIKGHSARRLYYRQKMYERDRGLCGVCGRPVLFDKMDLDHILPERDGGPTTWTNLRITHPTCNRWRPTTYAEHHGLVTATEVANAIGAPRVAIYRLAQAGRIPYHDVTEFWHANRQYLFRLSDVKAALGIQ